MPKTRYVPCYPNLPATEPSGPFPPGPSVLTLVESAVSSIETWEEEGKPPSRVRGDTIAYVFRCCPATRLPGPANTKWLRQNIEFLVPDVGGVAVPTDQEKEAVPCTPEKLREVARAAREKVTTALLVRADGHWPEVVEALRSAAKQGLEKCCARVPFDLKPIIGERLRGRGFRVELEGGVGISDMQVDWSDPEDTA